MCLAIPMLVTEVRPDGTATADLDGVSRSVDVALLSDVKVGEYVIVHAGYAIEKLDAREADELLVMLRDLADATPQPPGAEILSPAAPASAPGRPAQQAPHRP